MDKCKTCDDSVHWTKGGSPSNGRYVHSTRGNVCMHMVRVTRALNDHSIYNPSKIPRQWRRDLQPPEGYTPPKGKRWSQP